MTQVLPRRVTPPVIKRNINDSLKSIWGFINADDANKNDYSVNGSQIEFTARRTLAVPTGEGTKEYSFTHVSLERFCSLLDIPAKFFESCPVTGRGSQQDLVNQRLDSRQSESFMVRVRETDTEDGIAGPVRTVLKGNYAQFDNRHMLAAVERAITQNGGTYELLSHNADNPKSLDRGLYLRIVQGDRFDLADLNDPHQIGFQAVTCETGHLGHLEVNSLIHRLVCRNGMMGWAESSVLRRPFRDFRPHEVMAQMQEAVLSAVRQRDAIQEMLLATIHTPVNDPVGYLGNVLARRLRLPDSFGELAQAALATSVKELPEGSVSRFHVIQAITRAAASLPIEERAKIESKVGAVFFSKIEA
jgi:hypothetical protein